MATWPGATVSGIFAAAPPEPRITARPFMLSLLVAVVVNGLLRAHIRFGGSGRPDSARPTLRVLFAVADVGYIAVTVLFVLLLAAVVRDLITDRLPRRGLQQLLGGLATATLLVDLAAVNVTIYRRNLASYELLAESLALYIGTNLIFVFWYWHFDYPLREGVRRADQTVDHDQGIRFPEEELGDSHGGRTPWLPGLADYAYFTLLSSNCFGPPEGHVLIGRRIKMLQIVHTVFMIFIFIIIVARAINTLS